MNEYILRVIVPEQYDLMDVPLSDLTLRLQDSFDPWEARDLFEVTEIEEA